MKAIAFPICLFLLAEIAKGSGPVIPCTQCSDHILKSPESGLWYNPDEPGTGFSLDMQDGLLIGGYYGYNDDGNTQWFTFSGRPEQGGDDFGPLRLIAPLQRYEGGSCPNCPYLPPQLREDAGSIEIEFDQRNHGLFSINGSAEKSIIPLFAGINSISPFAEVSDYPMPDLQGTWVFVFENIEMSGPWERSSRVIELRGPRIRLDGNERPVAVSYPLNIRPFFPDITVVGGVECASAFTEAGTRAPVSCKIDISRLITGYEGTESTVTFVVPPAGFSDARIDATAAGFGQRLMAYRLNYE